MKANISKFIFAFLLLAFAPMSQGKRVRGSQQFRKKRCLDVVCPPIVCSPDHLPFIPKGQCCPVCEPTLTDCSAVRCITCADDEIPVFMDVACCPKCEQPQNVPDCSLVRCATPVCTEGYEPVKVGCCEICMLKANCQIVQCVTQPCPPICTDEETEPCDQVVCPQAACELGYEPVTLPGDCCSTCTPVMPEVPCTMMTCMDPCYSHSMENDALVPMCDTDQQCLTETVYISGGGDHCPPTGCPHFVGCE